MSEPAVPQRPPASGQYPMVTDVERKAGSNAITVTVVGLIFDNGLFVGVTAPTTHVVNLG